MNEIEALKELYEEVMDQVHELSADWRHSIPKKGMEEKWTRRRAQADCLERIINRAHSDFAIAFAKF